LMPSFGNEACLGGIAPIATASASLALAPALLGDTLAFAALAEPESEEPLLFSDSILPLSFEFEYVCCVALCLSDAAHFRLRLSSSTDHALSISA
jgi:hypothetical protein